MSNSNDSGNGRNCSGPKVFRSRDFERPLVGDGGASGSIASDDKSNERPFVRINSPDLLEKHTNMQ